MVDLAVQGLPDRRLQRLAQRLFRQIEVAKQGNERRARRAPVRAIDVLQPVARAFPHAVLSGQPGCPTGRTSIEPILANGERSARAIASLRSRTSINVKPPSCSLVSAKGPSVADMRRREHGSSGPGVRA